MRKSRAKNQPRNENWFLIVAKDNSCQGYIPVKDEEEACEKFGLKIDQCSVKRVEWSGEEFVEVDKAEQGKLLL